MFGGLSLTFILVKKWYLLVAEFDFECYLIDFLARSCSDGDCYESCVTLSSNLWTCQLSIIHFILMSCTEMYMFSGFEKNLSLPSVLYSLKPDSPSILQAVCVIFPSSFWSSTISKIYFPTNAVGVDIDKL